MAIITVTNASDNSSGTSPIAGSLRAAIQSARAGDIIRFSPQLANQTIRLQRRYSIDKNLTIDATAAPGLRLDARSQGILFQLDGIGRQFTLRGLTLANGYHAYNGAAIRVMNANARVTVENTNFYNNRAESGAAIWAKDGANVVVRGSKFTGNISTGNFDSSSGAISIFNKSKLAVLNSEFTNNRGFTGGALSTIFTELTVQGSRFINNQSSGFSGAIHADGASVPWQTRYYKGSLPRDREGKSIILENNYFEGNKATGQAGAVGIWGYDQDFVTLRSNNFLRNTISKNARGVAQGGGLRVSGKLVTIDGNRFDGNRSAVEGGGLYYDGESPTRILSSVFVNNQASQRGGAILNRQWGGPGTTIEDSVFRNNVSPQGGAIFKVNPTPLTLNSTVIQNNGTDPIGGIETNVVINDVASISASSSQDFELVPTAEFATQARTNPQPGLTATYFSDRNLQNPAFRQVDASVDFFWGRQGPTSDLPKNNFSVRWTGFIAPDYSETYRFRTTSDDGIRLWVGDDLLIDNWTTHRATVDQGRIQLKAGEIYPITLDYFENRGQAVARLLWSSPTQPLEVISSDNLLTSNPLSQATMDI